MIGVSLSRPGAGTSAQWWPQGAVFAADFINDRYMRLGEPISSAQAYSFTRASVGWAQDSDGRVREFAINEPRRTDRGLVLEPPRTRISLAPTAIGSPAWSTEGSTTYTVLSGEYPFDAPCRIESSGQIFSRRISAPIALAAGQTVHIKVRYRAGTSPNFGIYMRSLSGLQSILQGPVGALSTSSSGAGTWVNTQNVSPPQAAFEMAADFTPSTTDEYRLGLSPRSETVGEHVELLGAAVFLDGGPTSWILGSATEPFTRDSEAAVLILPATAHSLVLGLADGTSQTIASVSNIWQIATSLPAYQTAILV